MEEKFTPEMFASLSQAWNSILSEDTDIESIRHNLLSHINERHFTSYSDAGEGIHDLDLVIIRDCARVWRGILHERSETLAGESVLKQLVRAAKGNPDPELTEAFWAEIIHLVKGIEGHFRFHEKYGFSFFGTSELHGRDAAIARSDELDLIYNHITEKMTLYKSGLDQEFLKQREETRSKILSFTGASGDDWNDWHWQLKNIARNEKTLSGYTELSQQERENVNEVEKLGIPFGVTPYYASLFEKSGSSDHNAIRSQVLFPESYINAFGTGGKDDAINDFMLETDTSPIELITRRYPEIVILKPYNSCPQICVYCQRNWEIKGPLEPGSMAGKEEIDAAIEWISEHKAIREVLITGGDPFVLADDIIKDLLERVTAIDHVERIRFGTRTTVTLPMRITDELADLLASFRIPGKREIAVMTHIQHPLEITPDSVAAINRLRTRGIPVYNQLVYTFYISRRFEAARLRALIRLCGVDPYYSFYPKGKSETSDYRIPIARMLQEQKEESRLMPGLVRTDEPVYNVPGLGKNNLNGWQHRDMISIRKDGSRVYEFHPWEKKIADQNTYVGADVPLFEYLKKLESIGEDVSDYGSIWYYF